MMVNEFKNNAIPWQSTPPLQMPWMSSYDPDHAIQFGQQQQSLPIATTSHLPMQQPMGLLVGHHQQHPSPMINFPTATTLTTSPVTACPTSSSGNTLFAHNAFNTPTVPCGITTTTQSYTPQTMFHTQPNLATMPSTHSLPFSPQQSLTHIPNQGEPTTVHDTRQQKRSSMELEEDEHVIAQQPPTKQILSERKLFKKFGSLHLDRSANPTNTGNSSNSSDSDDSGEDDVSQPMASNSSQQRDRKEFDRYVYLLFKDKKGATPNFGHSSTFDRLMRDERDKMSKAVVLWSPPLKDSFLNCQKNDDDEDDVEFKYKDHRCFLKDGRRADDDDSIIITEITDEEARKMTSENCETDDLMLD